MQHFHFITAVWGIGYTESYVNVVIPSLLSPGNLLYLGQNRLPGTYKIFTTSPDAERIRCSPIFQRLSEAVPIRFVLIDDVVLSNKHEAMAECHRRAIREAKDVSAALVFLAPDLLFSEGTIKRLWEVAESGKRVVMLAGLRVVKETFVPWYRSHYFSDDQTCAPISGREMVQSGLDHLHPFAKSNFWDSVEFNRWPANIYWDVGREGIVVRGFHLHPLLVNPERRDIEPISTIDDDYILLVCPDERDWHVVRDSDEMIILDITDRSQFGNLSTNRASKVRVAKWAFFNGKPHHRSLSRYTIRFHHHDLSANWEPVERFADQAMNSIYFYLKYGFFYFGWRIVRRALKAYLMGLRRKILKQS